MTATSNYIASRAVILSSPKGAIDVRHANEAALPTSFTLDTGLIKVLVLDHARWTPARDDPHPRTR